MNMARRVKKSMDSDKFNALLFAFAALLLILNSCNSSDDGSSSRYAIFDSDDDDVLQTPFEVAEVRFADLVDDMRLVPKGIGPYGCDHEYNETCREDDAELQVISLEAFFIDAHEVTWGRYALCVLDGDCPDNECMPSDGGEDLPAGCVGAEDAENYCQWAGKRLPTDVEWERAARGLAGRYYPWGDQWCETCLNWCDGDGRCDGSVDGYSEAAPVAAFPDGASPYGALDMGGNVWEITLGTLGEGDETTDAYYARGGGFAYGDLEIPADYATELYRTYRRALYDETMKGQFLGFRCAVEAEYE